MMKFYQIASSEEKKTLGELIKDGKQKLAWLLVQKITGMKLKGNEYEN